MTITEQETARITRYLDVRTAMPEQADLVFVFGTRHPEPAYIAADLVKRGIGHYIILTGGTNRLAGIEEANTHLQILLGIRVSQACVIVESESTNTLENVVLALPKIEQRVDLDKLTSIVVVTKWYHCRRAMMTLKRHLPAGIRYFAATYEPQGTRRADWWQSEQSARRVLKEWDHIPQYLASGDIGALREEDDAFV